MAGTISEHLYWITPNQGAAESACIDEWLLYEALIFTNDVSNIKGGQTALVAYMRVATSNSMIV
jgi:hypothetical protein